MSIPIAFIICTEPGRLEAESLLLVESIRKFAGKLKDVAIYSFHPRSGDSITQETIDGFTSLNVIHQQIVLNTEFIDYPLANKPLICSYAEQTIEAEILVFLDSDKCIFQEPKELLLTPEYDIGIRPEYGKSIGSSGSWDPQERYWQKLYKLLNVRREVFVHTPIGNNRMRGYWNSGMVAVRRSAGIFGAWEKNFRTAMQLGIQPPQGRYMVEQSLLAATVCALDVNIYTLPPTYSYPLPLHNRLSKQTQQKHFDDLVSIHYFRMFSYDNWSQNLACLRKIDRNSSQYEWLCEKLTAQQKPQQLRWQGYTKSLKKIKDLLKVFYQWKTEI